MRQTQASWLIKEWVPGALFMGCLLTLLLPVLKQVWDWPILLIFLQLPIYMFHQVEEHTDDRFRIFVNQVVFKGVEALTPIDVLWINLPGVWGVNLLSLYAACFIAPGWGLSGPYLTVVNGISHIASALALRRYNPGLSTSVALFLPFGLLAIHSINQTPRRDVAPACIRLGSSHFHSRADHRRGKTKRQTCQLSPPQCANSPPSPNPVLGKHLPLKPDKSAGYRNQRTGKLRVATVT